MWKSNPNYDIRLNLFEKNITFKRVALVMGISSSTLSKWLSSPLSESRKERVLLALKHINSTEVQ